MNTIRLSKTAALAVALVLLVPVAMAIPLPDSETQGTVQECLVSGVVTEENGAPIEPATVLAVAGTSVDAAILVYDSDETDENGVYVLKLTGGNWNILAVDDDGSFAPARESVTLATGCDSTTTELNIEMPPLAALGNEDRGTLSVTLEEDVDGDPDFENVTRPMVGYLVTIYPHCEVTLNGNTAELPIATGRTNADGRLDLLLPTTDAQNACLRIDITGDFIDTGAGADDDGVYYNPGAVSIAAGETQEIALNFTKKLRFVTIAAEDNDVPDRLIGGAAVAIHHPVYCPGGVKPAAIYERYYCTATTDTESTPEGPAGKVIATLPIDGHADFGTDYQFHATHPEFFPKVDPCTVGNDPKNPPRNNGGNTPELQKDMECVVDMGHVSRVLSGRIVDGAGQPVAGATVDIDGALDLDDVSLLTSSDGVFTMAARSDDYTITVNGASNFCATVASTNVDLGDLALGASEQGTTGKVIDPVDGSAVADFPVRLRNEAGHACHTRTMADGTFSVSVRDDTKYVVTVGDEENLAIAFKELHRDLDFATGVTDLGTFVVERRDGQLEVTVRWDGNPDPIVIGADVECVNVLTGYESAGVTTSDGVAKFRVPFGDGYQCRASHASGDLESTDFEAADEVEQDNYDPDNDNAEKLSLLMDRRVFYVTGNVYDLVEQEAGEEPAPLGGVAVTMTNLRCVLVEGGSGCSASTTTDADGNYAIGVEIKTSPNHQAYPDNQQDGQRMSPVMLLFQRAPDYWPLAATGFLGPDAGSQVRPEGAQGMLSSHGVDVPEDPGDPGPLPIPGIDEDGDGYVDASEQYICTTGIGELVLMGTCSEGDYIPPGA